ncbi:flagellar export chaperone FliS [Microbacterium marinilacus]|uniref:Flagellar export chaperone FliS n=1 Tax=Microbacterium marinilacus TaxID=415209 RepID=A0ABP7B4T8_9MICO|nr:flagellar export chaperone FliS [Microbacterium marinilacus]MBY0687738.1 flagellar export chaperone FliS [Microbacterium marinilacus]
MNDLAPAPAARAGVAQLRAAQQRYQADAVMSAAPERLLTMLYDRLLLDIERGEAAQRAGEWQEANAQLQHAQSIVAELTASLTDAWDGAAGLRGVYAFLTTTLVGANLGRDPERTRSCRDLVAPLREAWHAAAQQVAAANARPVSSAFPAQARA